MKNLETQKPMSSKFSLRPRSVKAARMEPERLWRKGFVEQISFKSGVKGRGSDRWRQQRWWLWWGDMHRMRWIRRVKADRMKKGA